MSKNELKQGCDNYIRRLSILHLLKCTAGVFNVIFVYFSTICYCLYQKMLCHKLAKRKNKKNVQILLYAEHAPALRVKIWITWKCVQRMCFVLFIAVCATRIQLYVLVYECLVNVRLRIKWHTSWIFRVQKLNACICAQFLMLLLSIGTL